MTVNSLCVLKVATTCLQAKAAAKRRSGFMKFEPKGVEAAKMISPATSPTRRQIASGPFVIKPVIVPIPLVSLSASIISSIETLIRSISKIIPPAPIKANWRLPLKIRALPQKKNMTNNHTIRSRCPIASVKNAFMIKFEKILGYVN